jgi:arginine utilization regulatory protein
MYSKSTPLGIEFVKLYKSNVVTHADSSRKKGSFLAINCAAIPENLLEGILFGTVKGVFTGAVDRKGLVEQARGGTLFLDEINSMPLNLQSKILRVLEEKKVMRLGDKKEIAVDVRIISSCNVEPLEAIEKGQLREDLFYRLAVLYIFIPSLRERKDDLELLTKHFIYVFNKKMNKNIQGISDNVYKMFNNYSWPGNVRQLKHCMECAINLVSQNENLIELKHIPKYLNTFLTSDDCNENKNSNKRKIEYNIIDEIQKREKEEIISAIKQAKGNVAKAALKLNMSRQSLHYRLKKYNLK